MKGNYRGDAIMPKKARKYMELPQYRVYVS